MTLAKKIEKVLKNELKKEDIKTVIDLAIFLKFKNRQSIWDKINEAEPEYITEKENLIIKEIMEKDDIINQDDLLQELGIKKDEL
jgi:hypothetical protein